MKITEEVLKDLGFQQQNPPYIWDYYPDGGDDYEKRKNRLRFIKSNYGGKDSWSFTYCNAHPIQCDSVMGMFRIALLMAHRRGVEETQDKLHDALGFHRLIEQVVERVTLNSD